MNALANLSLSAVAIALAAAPLAAQNVDMIGATFSGTVQRLDSAQQSARHCHCYSIPSDHYTCYRHRLYSC